MKKSFEIPNLKKTDKTEISFFQKMCDRAIRGNLFSLVQPKDAKREVILVGHSQIVINWSVPRPNFDYTTVFKYKYNNNQFI